MSKVIFRTTLVFMLTALILFAGCKKADADKPIPEVKAEAQKMDVKQLRDTAMDYKEEITEKLNKIKEEGMKLKQIPAADLMSGKGKEITDKVNELQAKVAALKERFQIYVDELKKKGGDITGLQL